MAMIVRPFTEDYLLKYSDDHVFYEVDHFFWLAEFLADQSRGVAAENAADAVRVRNVLIEGFVIHLRNVIDFLYVSPRDSDVAAEDFLNQKSDWIDIRGDMSETLKTAKKRADKEIAHLTTGRMDGAPPEKEWDFVGLSKELKAKVLLFTTKAMTSRLSSRVVTRVR